MVDKNEFSKVGLAIGVHYYIFFSVTGPIFD